MQCERGKVEEKGEKGGNDYIMCVCRIWECKSDVHGQVPREIFK